MNLVNKILDKIIYDTCKCGKPCIDEEFDECGLCRESTGDWTMSLLNSDEHFDTRKYDSSKPTVI